MKKPVLGLTTEGIYRVCGNQAHVTLLQQKFLENPSASFEDLDIHVFAVATALKKFFSDVFEPVVPYSMYDELMQAISLESHDVQVSRISATLRRLPRENEELLKYLFRHLRKVAHHAHENQMDYTNLAKCLWPTLLRPHFDNFETMVGMTDKLKELITLLLQEELI